MKLHPSPFSLLASSKVYSGAVILAFAGVIGFGGGACAARGTEISITFRLVAYLGLPMLMTYWLQKDAKINWAWRVWDFGLFFYVAWPLAVPYHLLKTRRARGLIPIVAFLGTLIVSRTLGYLLFER